MAPYNEYCHENIIKEASRIPKKIQQNAYTQRREKSRLLEQAANSFMGCGKGPQTRE